MSEATVGNAVGEAVRAGVAAGPLFLVGVPRSGTTLLYKLLCLHPQDDLVRRRPGQRLCERRADGVAQAAVSQAGRG